MESPIFSSPLLGITVTLGNLAIWFGLASALGCVVLYWTAMIRSLRGAPAGADTVTANGGHARGNGAGNGRGRRNGRAVETPEQRNERIALWGRRLFYLTTILAIVGSICLWTLIFSRQFNIHYISKNTNNNLAPGFRFAAFWSDQEGTFFLWALYNGILGWFLLRKAKADERWVMPFFGLINVSLFTLLTLMNPFWLHSVAEVRTQINAILSEQRLPQDFIDSQLAFLPKTWIQNVKWYFGWAQYPKITDGNGLNEQLQNFWMVIHPPTLFMGYASMIIPGCFALGALMRRDYDGWVNRAAPWLMYAWMVLTTGLFLGAYWAYETLGWGGYWSWDPVENASIVPWVVGTALLHGLLAQRNRGNYKQANLFLGMMAAEAVLIGSFLVRSGVLTESSVHAFATPQRSVFITLLSMMVIWLVMGVGIWLWRFKDIQSEIAYEQAWERHFGFFLGLIVLSATAVVILFGVTLPIWKPLVPMLGTGKAGVDHTFYNKALLPVMFVTAILMALTPLMPWKQAREDARPLRPFSKVILGLALVLTLAFLGTSAYAWQGAFKTQNDPAYLVFGLALGLAFVTNVVCLNRARRGGLLNTGGWIAHIGFIVMLGGVLITTRYKSVHPVQKAEVGESVKLLGREFIFRGEREASKPTDRDRLLVDMVKNGKLTPLAPKLFISKQNGNPMAWPVIVSEWIGGAWGDIYVVPSGLDNSGIIKLENLKAHSEEPAIAVIQHRKSDPEDQVGLRFDGLDTSEMQKAMQNPNGKPFKVYAEVSMVINGEERQVRPALELSTESGRMESKPVPIRIEGLNQSTAYSLIFRDTNMQPSNLEATFEIKPDVPVSQGYYQVMHVPGIQVLWFGCYFMIAGGLITWLRRRQLAVRGPSARAGSGGSSAKSGESPAAASPEPVGAE